MRTIWLLIMAADRRDVGPSPPPDNLLYRVRTSKLYRSLFYALTHWVLPTICALLIYILLLYGAVVVTRCSSALSGVLISPT